MYEDDELAMDYNFLIWRPETNSIFSIPCTLAYRQLQFRGGKKILKKSLMKKKENKPILESWTKEITKSIFFRKIKYYILFEDNNLIDLEIIFDYIDNLSSVKATKQRILK